MGVVSLRLPELPPRYSLMMASQGDWALPTVSLPASAVARLSAGVWEGACLMLPGAGTAPLSTVGTSVDLGSAAAAAAAGPAAEVRYGSKIWTCGCGFGDSGRMALMGLIGRGEYLRGKEGRRVSIGGG